MEYSKFKLGSLFSGSGGFELAASLCGIEPVWASEIECYPIAVTRSRFPNMKHLGDISKINGAEIEPVDIVSFGSPCQGLSVAGLQKGLADERSELFLEAVRIIKEMREATNGRYPTFALWENVPGAFSSNKGEDFRVVLEELIKIAEPSAVMPSVPQKGWAYADYYCCDGWSLGYRVLDAQYIRTAQRRRRIYLVLDLGGQRANKILFERESLRGYPPQSGTQRQATSADAEISIGFDDLARNRECAGRVSNDYKCSVTDDREVVGFDRYNQVLTGGISATLRTPDGGDNTACVIECHGGLDAVAYSFDSLSSNSMKSSNPHSGCRQVEVAKTLDTSDPNPSKNQGGIAIVENVPYQEKSGTLMANSHSGSYTGQDAYNDMLVVGKEKPIAIDRAFYNQGQNALYDPQTYEDGTCPTLVAKGPGADCTREAISISSKQQSLVTSDNVGNTLGANDYKEPQAVCYKEKVRYIVRRLTPTECARLQGFPDKWGHPDRKDDFTDDEYRFWTEVRNTHAEINGKAVKEYTKQQMLTWYNKLHTDSAEYKMWGNGIALPCALYVMQGIEDALKGELDEIKRETDSSVHGPA